MPRRKLYLKKSPNTALKFNSLSLHYTIRARKLIIYSKTVLSDCNQDFIFLPYHYQININFPAKLSIFLLCEYFTLNFLLSVPHGNIISRKSFLKYFPLTLQKRNRNLISLLPFV